METTSYSKDRDLENILLETIKIGKPIDILKVDDGAVTINGIVLSYHHDSDCCEHVYADFPYIKEQIVEISGINVETLEIKAVPKMGILLSFDDKYKYFIPCFNSQNGYYSSNLKLLIEMNGLRKEIDISDFVEDKIY